MSQLTESIAWKLVAGLLVFLQLITLAFCGYIVAQIDLNRETVSALTSRIVVVETVQHQKEFKP